MISVIDQKLPMRCIHLKEILAQAIWNGLGAILGNEIFMYRAVAKYLRKVQFNLAKVP
jgi:hypothetical protein